MKISSVEALAIRIPVQGKGEDTPPVESHGRYYIDRSAFVSIYSKDIETTVVRIRTDDGTTGYGEAQAPIAPRVCKAIIEDIVRPLVVGRDPFDAEAIWTRCYGAMRERGHPTGFYVDALAGVDIALYDIMGKATGKPAHRLLGGRYRDAVEIYAGIGGTDTQKVADEAAEHVGYGYRALKLHLLLDRDRVVEIVRAVRDRVGPSIQIMVDVHTRHTVTGAIELGRRLEELDVRWLESPTAPEDIPGQAEIARALDMPVAIGEWSRTRYEMREAFERRAFDIVMPDIARTGLTEGKRIAALADTYNIPISPHIGRGGIISVAASVQYSAAIPNFMVLEHSHRDHTIKQAILKTPYGPVNGSFRVTDAPGLGLDISDSALEKYAI
ncbi:MAG: mandelate racemase/muconate lactonizing enzyme family protein [Dehalococcoidia bacterium]|nr:mandelate racemase/muconate lactonizing enzyme family protein [Dehalococcoidia bacterium]MSQ35355.1 mandelate racemase/muconate lactonizing enzyme family protein [Dehalococcoidia bacterium]